MEKIKQVAVAGLLILVGLAAWGAVITALNPEGTTEPTAAARDNTFKNMFVSGCVDEANKAYPEDDNQSFCSCGYEQLLVMHPDFTTNTELQQRILDEGYNQAETDAMVVCAQ